ncbi:MAG: acyl-CoA dehydrogenase C-terminal domain-containing protein [Gammaproteobacteria bacterium]|nr:acyl-CoA dehydrogenase C-terminal domain-containing protein [Gammaproteobacteria bacterium]
MLEYHAPRNDLNFLLFDVFKVQEAWADIDAFADFSDDLARAVVEEGGKLAGGVLAPVNQAGDEHGCSFTDGAVTTPPGFKEAFAELAGGGWLGLSGNPRFGGQGMPKLLGCLLEEMFWAANSSLYLYGTLTVGAAICIDAHGSDEQKALYLPKLYSGEWTGAMALTEAHAGSDLGIMRTRAEPQADGTYAISGTKIFITSGEHDLADNIIHLVLAKLPDAPAGSRGISLFIVPRFIPADDGTPGERNAFAAGSIEKKMGIHGSATCVMNYDGATGYLVGEENQGLAAMFTMMNYERLSVGLQGLGAGELAYQAAADYAGERLQGRAPSGPVNADGPADPLIVHPDVRRMLLTIRALTEGGRAFAMFVGMQLDRGKYAGDARAQAFSELLTPVAKAFLTDRGFDCAVLAQQILGGHGYVTEWGLEQVVRDVRIAQIYEGTNGIQAMDLIGRKVLRDGGETLDALLGTLREEALPDDFREPVEQALSRLERVTATLVERSADDANVAGAAAVEYLDLVGYTFYAWLWAKMAGCAAEDSTKRATARFFMDRLLPRTAGLEQSILADSRSVMDENLFDGTV